MVHEWRKTPRSRHSDFSRKRRTKYRKRPKAAGRYVFVRNGATWTEIGKLLHTDPSFLGQFSVGGSVDIVGGTIIVGAFVHDIFAPIPSTGDACIYDVSHILLLEAEAEWEDGEVEIEIEGKISSKHNPKTYYLVEFYSGENDDVDTNGFFLGSKRLRTKSDGEKRFEFEIEESDVPSNHMYVIASATQCTDKSSSAFVMSCVDAVCSQMTDVTLIRTTIPITDHDDDDDDGDDDDDD